MLKRLFVVLIPFFLAILLLGNLIFFSFLQLKPKQGDNALYILKADSIPSLNQQLSAKLTFVSNFTVRIAMSLLLDESKLRDGKYAIDAEMTAFQLVKNLRNGHQSEVKLIIAKSRNFENFEAKIKQSIHISSQNLITVLDSVAVLDITTRNSVPQSYLGLIIPETHRLYWNCSNRILSRKLKDAYLKFWNAARKEKAAKLGLSRYEVMILASIVEEETSLESDKPRIASVYYNRLRKGMRLQADPTIIFAWQDYSIHRVLNKHLEIDSPYNTYRKAGLPPAPICIPSISSIDAVLTMPLSIDFYFCADPSFNGSHIFTSNYTDHLKNAHAYQAAYRQRFDK